MRTSVNYNLEDTSNSDDAVDAYLYTQTEIYAQFIYLEENPPFQMHTMPIEIIS